MRVVSLIHTLSENI